MANSNKRKPLSKKIRFEVFKRDGFKCQYCGKSRDSHPELILHVDHLEPVAKGGENELLNLITACNTCNQGKSDTPLDDNTYLNKSRNQADILHERREQLKMQMEWVKELRNTKQETIDSLCKYWNEYGVGFIVLDNGKKTISKLYKKYLYEEITNAMDTAAEQYLEYKKDGNVTSDSWNNAFDKIGGICRVEKESKDDPDLKQLYYIRGIARKNCGYFVDWEGLDLLKAARSWNISLDYLFSIAKRITSWTQFKNQISDAIDEAEKKEDEEPRDEDWDEEVKFVVSFSEEEAVRIKDTADDKGITPEELIWGEVNYAVQNTSDEQNAFWVLYLVNPNDKEDFIFYVDTIRPQIHRFVGKSKEGSRYVEHFWGEYWSKNDIAREMLTWAKEIYAFPLDRREVERFSGESDIDRLTIYLEKAYEDVLYCSRQPKIK